MKISKVALELLVDAIIREARVGEISYPAQPQPYVVQAETLETKLQTLEKMRRRNSAIEEACEYILEAAK